MKPSTQTEECFARITREDLTREGLRLDLSETETHVWGFLLESDADVVSALWRSLSAEERDRADRLVSNRHREERVIAYGALRVLLSRYQNCAAHELRFERTPQGKPVLQRDAKGGRPVRFNLTHSHGRALIAVTKEREVGIDLEKVRARRDVAGLVERFLSSEEQRAIERAVPEAKAETFVRLWVAREAALKAMGTGLTFPLDRCHVAISGEGAEARLVGPVPDDAGSDYAIRFLPVAAGWIAAVAACGHDWHARLCRADER